MTHLTRINNMKTYSIFENLLSSGLTLRVKVTGKSMSPFLETGSYVTLYKIPLDKLKVGDIIFCQCHDGLFKLHRLIQMTPRKLLTKGDALLAFDPPFDINDYRGKVISIETQQSVGISYRNMERPSARIVNCLIARYQQLRVYFNCICVRLKSKPA